MKCSSINITEVRSMAKRLDAPVHLSDGVMANRLIESSPYGYMTIGDVSSRIWHAGRWKRVYVNKRENGIILLGSSAILKSNLEDEKLISRKYTDDIEDKRLKKGWILISCSGTIGNCAFTNAQHAEKLASQHVIRINPNNILRPGIIYAYLASKYGYSMLTQGTFGSVIQHIEPENVKAILIPKFPETFQEKVDDLIQESAKLREEAASLLKEAQDLIMNEINISLSKKVFGKVSINDIITSYKLRFEANFHISEGADIEKFLLSNFNCKTLGDLCTSISRPDIFKRYYVSHGITFLGGADIFLATPNSDKQLSKKKTENINNLLIEEGTILLPRSGTIGNVAWAHAGHAQKLASEDVIRLKPNDILRGGYLFAFLSTSIGRSLIQKHIFGSVIQHVEAPHLSLIPIPVLDDKIILHTHENVMTYGKNMGEAIKKESQAISLIEQEIECWSKN